MPIRIEDLPPDMQAQVQQQLGLRKSKQNKYRNVSDGEFDSQKERHHFEHLRMLERVGLISNLQTQVKFELIPKQTDEQGKVIERAVSYIADFVHTDKEGKRIVTDVKGYRTEIYRLKKKMMLYFHGIKITEI